MTTYSDEFEDHIRDLLSYLYDYLKLVENPIALQLARGYRGVDRVEMIRSAVLAAIDQLRREKAASPTSRQQRLYRILQLRYIEELSTTQVLHKLALSERQYYREHQRALQTVSRIIWDEHFAGLAAGASFTLADELDYLSVERGDGGLDARAEVLAALRSTRVIADHHGIAISMDESDLKLRLNLPQPVFRQLVIYVLNDFMAAMPDGGQLSIEFGGTEAEPAIAFSSPSLKRELFDRLLQDSTALALLNSLNARLEFVAPPPQIALKFQRIVHNILIVDDNPDTIALFKRYLAHLPYHLLAARGEGEALQIVHDTPLLCIILDIMLPGKDGWQLLQRFKTHPATAQIPVLICSVLEMDELALSLGADGYLKKPPPRAELVALLSQWAG